MGGEMFFPGSPSDSGAGNQYSSTLACKSFELPKTQWVYHESKSNKIVENGLKK
jgi:hypothetical protein